MNGVRNSTRSVTGWVSSPEGRGTIDIVWSSFLTIFLCTWTAVCLNIPHPDASKLKRLCNKAKWMLWAIIGPELVLAVAIGQFASARRSVKRFHGLQHKTWTLRHGFFADMGGILLQPRNSTPFLVNSRQLTYLVEHQYMEYPDITAEEIWDKSKADTLARILTLLQACWLVIQLLGRAILHLATTTLELSAGAIVLCTLGTFVCWLHKPNDVQKGVVLTIEATTAQILIDAGDEAAAPYRHTPLDFIAKQSFTCGYDMMGFLNLRCDNRERPLRCFPNDRFPDIGSFEKLALFCMTTTYAAFHLVGWNFTFPTRLESLLWRVSSSLILGATVFWWVFETIAARHRFGRWDKYLIWLRLKKTTPVPGPDVESGTKRQNTRTCLDDFEMEQKQAKPMLIWEVGLLMPMVFLYAAARTYMIVEALVSLRQLPIGVYRTFDLAQILPHW